MANWPRALRSCCSFGVQIPDRCFGGSCFGGVWCFSFCCCCGFKSRSVRFVQSNAVGAPRKRPGFCWVSFFYKKNPRPIPQNGLPNTKKGTAPLHFFFIPRSGPNFFIPGSEPFLYHARHFPTPETEYTRNSTF